jgi:hypothetical protein
MPYSDRIESPPGYPGMQGSRRVPGGIITLLNGSNEIAQVNTVTVGTVAAAVVYRLVIDGQTVTYTALSTDTATTVIAKLVELVNLNGLGVRAQASSSTAFTLTGYPGVPFVITGSGGVGFAIAQTTASAVSSPIKFGRAIVQLSNDQLDVGRLPSADDQKFKGVTLASQKMQEYSGLTYYRQTEQMPVVRQGSLWVEVEAQGSDVYVRHAAAGALTEVGGFSGVSGTGLVLLSGAEWLARGTGIAELSLSGLEAFAP